MSSGVSQIKRKNHSLAIQATNNTNLTDKLQDLCAQLKLHTAHEQILKNPNFKPDRQYRLSLKAVDVLSQKLNLSFPDGLESMKAVKSQQVHFKMLNERFCTAASQFLADLFDRNSRTKEKYDIPRNKYEPQRFVGPHTPIHAVLFKYDELVKYIEPLHSDKFRNVMSRYESAFSKLYEHEFNAYFKWVRGTIYDEQRELRMATIASIELRDLRKVENDDDEVSQSTNSTIFTRTAVSADGMGLKSTGGHLGTIREDIDVANKDKITKIYRQCLAEVVPIILVEQQFMEHYLFSSDVKAYKEDVDRMLQSMFGHLEQQLLGLIDKADSMNKFNTLEMLIISERVLHTFRDYNAFMASMLSTLHTKLTLNWNAFISQEIEWIKNQKMSIKQAGILVPMQKFPAFCNEMYKVVTFGDEKSKEITDVDALVPHDALHFVKKSRIVRNLDGINNGGDHLMLNGARTSTVVALSQEEKGSTRSVHREEVVFRESEQVTNTIHKMTTVLFKWLEGAAESDKKYTSVCLMENYHYFYSVFSKTESLRSIREHVHKAKRNYDRARRSYVKWSVRYEATALTDFWDDFEQKTLNDIETVTVYISAQKVKAVCAEWLDSKKKIGKLVEGMFGRLRKHLADNDVLFAKIWRKIAEYFCSKYKKFKENVDAIYVNNSRNNKFLKFSFEFVWNQFVVIYQNAFGSMMDDNSSLSESVGGSSMNSGLTIQSYYSQTTGRKMKKQVSLGRNALSSLRRKKNKGSSNASSNGSY